MTTKIKKPTKRELAAAQRVINAQREAEYAGRRRENAKFIGRYFKYRNSSGGDREKWWLYAAVTEVDELGTIHGWTFQRTPDGDIDIRNKGMYAHRLEGAGYQEITSREFWTAAQHILGLLTVKLLPSPLGDTTNG